MAEAASTLTHAERDLLLDIANRVMPGGSVFPPPDAGMLDRLDELFEEAPAGLRLGLRGALQIFEQSPRLGLRGPYSQLDSESRQRHLEAWLQGGEVKRNILRSILILLKIYRYADPRMYQRIGCPHGAPPVRAPIEHWRSKVVPAASLNGQRLVDADVVVVGTGAGGAVVAKELAERGLAVVMVEEAEYFTREQFNGKPAEMQRRLYRGLGMTVAAGNTLIYCPVGKTVGGSTTVNSGTCLRPSHERLRSWEHELGLRGFGPGGLAPYLDRVESILGVAPVRDEVQSNNARLVARGAERLGLEHGPLQRNAPDCDGSGLCPFGCPSDAKRSTNVSYVPLALKSNAFLYTGLRAEQVIVRNGRAAGVLVSSEKYGKQLELRARAVVLAGGAFGTPALLRRSHIGNGRVGRNLSLHPCGQVAALFDAQVDGYRGVPQGYGVQDRAEPGIRYEGVSVPLELTAAMFDLAGESLTRAMESYRNLSTFGFMIDDSSRGRLLGEVGGWPLITYWLNRRDFALVRKGMETLAEIYFAAGASKVFLPVNGHRELMGPADLARFRTSRIKPRDVELGAFHPLGTCRMGSSPRNSVLNPDLETWDVDRLYVTDGSAIPTALGVNPQVTIMAVATRAAEGIARRLGA